MNVTYINNDIKQTPLPVQQDPQGLELPTQQAAPKYYNNLSKGCLHYRIEISLWRIDLWDSNSLCTENKIYSLYRRPPAYFTYISLIFI